MRENKGEMRTITGNAAAAYGAMLCRPDVVALYPITPQTEVVEQLSRFHADGLLDAEMVEAEGENSVMNIVTGATIAGGRVFTATSSWGLAFMYDALLHAAGFRAPIVMVNVNREMPGILAVSAGQQDMVATRDTGWIQVIAEDCQEILDTVIMAYRLAEDYEIQLPVMVNYDGFYLSFLAEGVHIPGSREVDRFLDPLKRQPERPKLRPGQSLGCGTHGIDRGFVELRYKHSAAMERAKGRFDEIDNAFQEAFGRSYGGQIEEYRMSDADIALVVSGSATGTAKTVIDRKREEGIRVGLVKIKMFRPFPQERLITALRGIKALGVVDRSICFGWNSGPIHMELRAIGTEFGPAPMLGFIGGLANMDISTNLLEEMIERVQRASQGEPYEKVTWLNLEG
jgi:pyruvate/2-oxoacid:ferredoxin oxidoreductase alpha subunit